MKDYIAIITAGGHISSFHCGMEGAARRAEKNNVGIIGFKDGYKGANSGKYYELDTEYLLSYLETAGSVIGSSREESNPSAVKSVLEKLAMQGKNILGIIGMSGDDHLAQLNKLYVEENIPVVGWPKTMDNDLSATYFTCGYPTAAMNAAKAIRQAFIGAWTNSRIHITTMFERDTNWVVAAAGAWGAADLTIGGEGKEYDIREIYENAAKIAEENKKQYGRKFGVIAVGEDAKINGIESHIDMQSKDIHGHPKLVPEKLALEIQNGIKKLDSKFGTSIDTLTYNDLRNCPPIDIDADIAWEAGYKAADEILKGHFGIGVIIKDFNEKGGNENDFEKDICENVTTAPLADVAKKRFLAPEGFMDYDAMKPTQKFIDYYTPLFGKPMKKEEVIFKKLEEMSV